MGGHPFRQEVVDDVQVGLALQVQGNERVVAEQVFAETGSFEIHPGQIQVDVVEHNAQIAVFVGFGVDFRGEAAAVVEALPGEGGFRDGNLGDEFGQGFVGGQVPAVAQGGQGDDGVGFQFLEFRQEVVAQEGGYVGDGAVVDQGFCADVGAVGSQDYVGFSGQLDGRCFQVQVFDGDGLEVFFGEGDAGAQADGQVHPPVAGQAEGGVGFGGDVVAAFVVLEGELVEADGGGVGGEPGGQVEAVYGQADLAFVRGQSLEASVEADVAAVDQGEDGVCRGGIDDVGAAGQGGVVDGDVGHRGGRRVGLVGLQEFEDGPVGGRGVVLVGEDAGSVEDGFVDLDFLLEEGGVVDGGAEVGDSCEGVLGFGAAFVAEMVGVANVVPGGEFFVGIDEGNVVDFDVEVGKVFEDGGADAADGEFAVYVFGCDFVGGFGEEAVCEDQLDDADDEEP